MRKHGGWGSEIVLAALVALGCSMSRVWAESEVSAAAVQSEPAAAGLLDGKTFIGEVGEVGKAAGNHDELIFRAGAFRSTACDPYGFGNATYTTTAHGETVTFQTETVSPTDGRMQWQGTIQGDELSGRATWFRQGKVPVDYWVKAKLKQQG